MGSGKLDFLGLKQELLNHARSCLARWLPGGKIVGSEYVCGSLQGERGNSLSVNLRTGVWKDFATEESGGDLIDLYAAITGLSIGDAARELSDEIGFSLGVKPSSTSLSTGVNRVLPKPITPPSTITKAPLHLARPDFTHKLFGMATHVYDYRDEKGELLFYVARYDTTEGKQFYPWAYDSALNKWVTKGWPAPRPLFGLDLLAKYPDRPVLVVEGEKAAVAAQDLVGDKYVVVTWANGSQAWDKADFTPLYGRDILLWPDRDYQKATRKSLGDEAEVNIGEVLPYEFQPGTRAMMGIASLLKAEGRASTIKILDVSNVGPPFEQVKGFDAADMLEAGWTFEKLVPWAKERAKTLKEKSPKTSPDSTPTTIDSYPIEFLHQYLGLDCTKKGRVYQNASNVLRVIEKLQTESTVSFQFFRDLIWFDDFHKKLYTKWNSDRPRQWTSVDEDRLTVVFQSNLGMPDITDKAITKALKVFAYNNTRNEPREWLQSLVWDEVPRIELFLHEAMEVDDNEYSRAVSKNLFIAMVARIFEPGCKFDQMVILEGEQGRGKSTALKDLGGPFYGELTEDFGTPNFYQSIQGLMIIEVSELDAFSKAEVTTVKRVLSSAQDRVRVPYASHPEDFPRQGVFVGTTNEEEYLKDPTGARRFWPVRVGIINREYIQKFREQFFSEAVRYFKDGTPFHVVPDELAKQEQEARRDEDIWLHSIKDYIKGKEYVLAQDIAEFALLFEKSRVDQKVQNRITRILKGLHFYKKSVRINGEPRKAWFPKSSI